METSVHWDFEANLKGRLSQTRVTIPKASLADQTAFLAQTAMGVAVHSEAVVGVARGASPVAASLEVPMAVDLGASTEEVAAVDSYNYSAGVGPLRKLNQINQEEDRLILFFLSLRNMKFRPVV